MWQKFCRLFSKIWSTYDHFYVCDNLLSIDHHCLTSSLHHPFSHPQVSLSLLLLSFSHLQNHCGHSHFSKIFIMPFPWGWGRNRLVQNKVRFLCHKNMFLISIHIFLLFSTCTLAKQINLLFLEYTSFILFSLPKMTFSMSLSREFFQGIG